MGEEQASQWRFFETIAEMELSLNKIPGVDFMNAQELMSEEAKGELMGAEESLRRMGWTGFGHPVRGKEVAKI